MFVVTSNAQQQQQKIKIFKIFIRELFRRIPVQLCFRLSAHWILLVCGGLWELSSPATFLSGYQNSNVDSPSFFSTPPPRIIWKQPHTESGSWLFCYSYAVFVLFLCHNWPCLVPFRRRALNKNKRTATDSRGRGFNQHLFCLAQSLCFPSPPATSPNQVIHMRHRGDKDNRQDYFPLHSYRVFFNRLLLRWANRTGLSKRHIALQIPAMIRKWS